MKVFPHPDILQSSGKRLPKICILHWFYANLTIKFTWNSIDIILLKIVNIPLEILLFSISTQQLQMFKKWNRNHSITLFQDIIFHSSLIVYLQFDKLTKLIQCGTQASYCFFKEGSYCIPFGTAVYLEKVCTIYMALTDLLIWKLYFKWFVNLL